MRLGKLNKNTVLLLICALNIIILNFWSQDRKEAIQKVALESDILMHQMATRYYQNDVYLMEEIEKVYSMTTDRWIQQKLLTRNLIEEKIKEFENVVPNLVKEINPSVVMIEIPYRHYDHYTGEEEIRWGGGAGVFYGEKGHILSVAHITVGLENPDPSLPSPRIRTYDGKRWDILSVASNDNFSYSDFNSADVGMIRISSKANYPSVSLGRLSDLDYGQTMIVFGHPYLEPWSISTGVLSRIGFEDKNTQLLLQIDARVNGGNSGGPVVGLDGRCYGLCSFVVKHHSSDEGLNFFVPVQVIKKWLPKLLEELE